MSPELIHRLNQHKPSLVGLSRCHLSAVLIPLVETPDGLQIILEERSPQLQHQPGDICLPGGGIEAGETPEQAAIRETCEELLVRPEQIEVLGTMDILHTETLVIHSFAARLTDYQMTYSTDEVTRVFSVPLSFFQTQKPEEYTLSLSVHAPEDFPFSRVYGGRQYRWRTRREYTCFYQYGANTIWGLTARILRAFAAATLPETEEKPHI